MFSTHIMRMSARRVVAAHGYRSALQSFRKRRAAHARMLKRHGIGLRDPFALPETPPASPYRSEFARALAGKLDFLDGTLRAGGRR
jgi:hypothetical protein